MEGLEGTTTIPRSLKDGPNILVLLTNNQDVVLGTFDHMPNVHFFDGTRNYLQECLCSHSYLLPFTQPNFVRSITAQRRGSQQLTDWRLQQQ
jgi:hypothetical protein